MLIPAGTQTQEEGKARDLTQGNVTQMQRLGGLSVSAR